ncbi:hypothetical protein RUM43_013676 [Polyplax serrata]|uniref:Uncharacterized protein n=1 Tax=Polyplax serrata TaxID=468196 RepID=A0AAN8RZ09_POLSC
MGAQSSFLFSEYHLDESQVTAITATLIIILVIVVFIFISVFGYVLDVDFKNCIDDHFGRNQRRMERMLRGGSLGRNLIRNLGEGFNDQLERPPCVTEVQEEADGKYTGSNEDGSRVSLRFSSWKIPQGSLSRVLSFKQNRQFSFPNYKSYVRPIQSPTSSEYGSIVSSFSYRASSPPEFGRPSTPSSVVESDAVTRNFIPKRKRKHRRAKSIGDIAVSPV